jgi:hypothetical protein
LSITGDAWKALRSKLMEDPGPHSSVALPVAVGNALPVPDAGPAGDAGSKDPVEVAGASAEFGTPHATADIAKSIVKADPNIVARLFGWNISVAFRRWNMDPSNCARPTMWWAALAEPRRASGTHELAHTGSAEEDLSGLITEVRPEDALSLLNLMPLPCAFRLSKMMALVGLFEKSLGAATVFATLLDAQSFCGALAI